MSETEIIIPTYEQYVLAGCLREDWQRLLRFIVEHETLRERVAELEAATCLVAGSGE